MYLKLQAPVPGQQPNVGAGGLASMEIQRGFRIGVVYALCQVTLAALGAGNYSVPKLTDIVHPTTPCVVKIGGNPQVTRLGSELIAMNLLQDASAGGKVDYYQGGAPETSVPVATVLNANNTATPAALAANTATTAVFTVPIYFAEYWRRNLQTAESLSWPTVFSDGSQLPTLTVEIPVAANSGGNFSAWGVKFWYDYDSLVWPASSNGVNYTANGVGQPMIVKKDRYTQQYSGTGDFNITTIKKRDALMQFSLQVATGDFISRVVVKKNGLVIRDVFKSRNDQVLQDHGMNVGLYGVAGNVSNRFDIVFDVNDDPNSALPLAQTDIIEIIATLSVVQAAATMVVLTESYGRPY